ncbi:unnamed protein product [Spirodela intermedia]|uniref:Uncharacterized protein n=1 Tax=Spirodela intermedia TaxID=51605 RepID=A0A7I8L5P1_SPIIN|nr:unnamed protein product [Spirodela intermedia]
MGFNWIILPILLFNFTVTLALTNSGDAAALRSLENIWANVPLNWQGSDPCSSQWTGVGCRDNRVVSIRLSSIGLEGTLSGDIESLTELEILQVPIFLDLSYNKGLTGNLPAAIGNLRQLTDLSLNSNQFTGGIPSSLGKLSKLYWLLDKNNFTGIIPPTLGLVKALEVVRLRNNLFNGTLDIGSNFSGQLQLVDLENNRIERFVEGGGYKNELRLLGNPYCDQSTSDTRCATGIRSTLPYTTPIPNCQQLTCSADQKQSPNCRCAYPYTGNLYFRAVSFSDLWNATKFQALEAGLLKSFQSQQIPVGSVALSNTFTNEDSYLQTTLQVFPAENPRFNQSEISIIGFILSNQTFKPPSFFGPFFFIGTSNSTAQGSSSDSSSKSNVPVIIGAVAGGCVIALIASFLVVYVMRRKKEPSKPKEQSQPFGEPRM